MPPPISQCLARQLQTNTSHSLRLSQRGSSIATRIHPISSPSPRCIAQAKIFRRHYRPYTEPTMPMERIYAAVRKEQSSHPLLFRFALMGAFLSVSAFAILAYDSYTRGVSKDNPWPPAVEQSLRLALHYTHVSPDPDLSARAYTTALDQAERVGMDPFSKEVMGIRIKLAEMLEKFGRVKGAVEVLISIANDCTEKVEELDRGMITKGRSVNEVAIEPDMLVEQQRKSLLGGIVRAKVKIATLYDGDYIQDSAKAKSYLSEAMGLLVEESEDPTTNGFSEANRVGLTMDEISAMLLQMGDLYATSGEEDNAVQVYMLTLQPLRLACNGKKSCKEAQVLCNIASTMAFALKKPRVQINGKPATKSSLQAARKAALAWADQAIATAERVDRNESDEGGICDMSRVSALATRAETLLALNDKAGSRAAYTTLLETVQQLNLSSMVKVAEDGLRMVSE